MLKARNRKLSMILVLAMLMTMFVGIGTASASSTYTALSTPTLVSNGGAQDLGVIQVDISSAAAVKVYDVLTISLPSQIKMANFGAATLTPAAGPAGVNASTKVEVFIPNAIGGGANGLTTAAAGATAVVTATKTSIDITFGATGTAEPGRMLIYIEGADIGSIDGDVVAQMLAPANSAFAMGSVVVGKASSTGGSTMSSVLSVKTFGNAGGQTDIISVVETAPDTLPTGEIIKVKLPNGFKWASPSLSTPAGGTQSWGWVDGAITPTVTPNGTDSRILDVTVNGTKFPSVAGGLSGRVNFMATILVDESVAKTGDITARIYSNNGNVTEQDVVIAKYGTYGVTVTEVDQKEIVAGKHDQKIGSFYIAEDLADSLLNNRNIKLTLPVGVKWSGQYEGAGNMPAIPGAESGNASLGAYTIADSDRTLKTAVTQAASPSKTKFKFKDLRVDVAPDFVGDITVTVSGDAGATGEVVVANVKSVVELSSEEVKNVRIGEQNQELGTLIIKENKKEAIALQSQAIKTWASATIAVQDGEITLTLPNGSEWAAGYPSVEVIEGDLQLKTGSMSKNGAVLTIPVKSESTKPSTIKVSGMKATLYRTVPEGDFKVAVSGAAINETGGQLAATNLAFPQFEAIKVAVAKCVTPAPLDGTQGASAGEFRIDSNIYYVGGVAKVMDAAPYIKNDRTYVPMRFLGEMMGAEVVWDDAARTVTLTRGDDVVVFTIGSTSYTVNGEAKAADVAPEIVNSRTMLPARFVAEAFGAVVGWDPGTRTVLISN